MARLRQTEPKKETINGIDFYIKPFPAMVAANLSGELGALITPLFASLLPLVSDSLQNDSESEGGLLDTDVNQAAASMAKSLEGFSGAKVEAMMKKLLVVNKNVAVQIPEVDKEGLETGEYQTEILDMDLVNEIFCGEVQDMFILAFYVIRLNFGGFFEKVAHRFGKAGERLVTKTKQIF